MAGTAAKFVQLVEKYPCLYNNNLAEYGRQDITKKAWSEVANEIQWTVNGCKEKWKNIRNGFVRSLKPKTSGSATTKKKYYIHEEMQFILPYVKPVIHMNERGNSPNPEQSTLIQEKAAPPEEQAYHMPIYNTYVGPNRNITEETVSENLSHVERPSFQKQKIGMKPLNNETDKAFVDWLKTKENKEDDPRKMFLLSLLPDIQSLTDEEMKVFRIKMLMLLEEIKKPRCSVIRSQMGQ